jgi:hypothetical protein
VKFVWYGLTFVAGAVVGGLIVREIAISKIETPVGDLADKVFGKDSYASGQTKTWVNQFLRAN